MMMVTDDDDDSDDGGVSDDSESLNDDGDSDDDDNQCKLENFEGTADEKLGVKRGYPTKTRQFCSIS